MNWFFIQKFKEFAKQYYIKHLNACPERGGWLWYRFEWQHRGAIHVHGLLRMSNMPDTYDLAKKCIKGHVISLKSNLTVEEKDVIQEGLDAENTLIAIYDNFINCETLYPTGTDEACILDGHNIPRPQSLKASSIKDK